MFMCLWENSHFLCIEHTQTKYSIFVRKYGILTGIMKIKMLAVPVMRMIEMLQMLMRLMEVMKTMMMIRAGWVYVCAGL